MNPMRDFRLPALALCTLLATGLVPDPIRAADNAVSSGGRLKLPGSSDGASSLKEIEAAEAALGDLWAKGPYVARRAMFVASKTEFFGNYEPRPTNVFGPGEALLTYIEPIGYDWKQQGDRYTFGVIVDLEITTPNGKVVGGQKAFQNAQLTSRYRVREFFVNNTLTLDDISAGDYLLVYTLHDQVSGRSTKVELPFVIKR